MHRVCFLSFFLFFPILITFSVKGVNQDDIAHERAQKYFGGVYRDAERIVQILKIINKEKNSAQVSVADFFRKMDELCEKSEDLRVGNFNKSIFLLSHPDNGHVSLPQGVEYFTNKSEEIIEINREAIDTGREIVQPSYRRHIDEDKEQKAIINNGKHGRDWSDKTSQLTQCYACQKAVDKDQRRQIAGDRLYHYGCLVCYLCQKSVLEIFPGVSKEGNIGHNKCVAEEMRKQTGHWVKNK